MLHENKSNRGTVRKWLEERTTVSFEDDSDLMALGVLDSLQIMELIAFLEDSFTITIDASDITNSNLSSITSIDKLIIKIRNERKN